ncbi:MAG: tRNA pseudouridine(55) synthase TruB [Bacteroidales bacterium]|nr:tRNA pseudouridine(55) synthase TruB [Bacteroidales bacterium]MCF8456478.1 tRNA pseudouridine(55) synthase TruB [Bacteroidales bacterium]
MFFSETTRKTDFQTGLLILIDKPYRWSSFDVVKKIKSLLRYRLDLKKIKIGHGGTLDPLATGLMIVATGKFTKQLFEIQGEDKEYIADIKLGATTPSYDLETEVDATFSVEGLSKERVEEVLAGFIGENQQLPPIFSAKWVDGKRAYEYARKGQDLEMKPSQVYIREIELLNFDLPDIVVRVKCSKGTYIRSLAHDIGVRLENGAHLTGLRRTFSGDFKLSKALTVNDFEELIMKME